MKQTFLLVIACASLCLIVGCTSPSHPNSKAKQKSIAKLIEAKNGAQACIMYADAHGGQYPPDLPALAGFADTNFLTKLAADFDLVYSGNSTNITKPYDTIILREKQAIGGGKLIKAYGYADGHAETHRSEDGNFDSYENERVIKP